MSDLIPCRIERTEKYRSISLIAVEDSRLSWAAKGLHTYLVSRPENWKLYYSDLLKRSRNSRTALKSAVRELKDAGYIVLEPIQGEGGKFNGWSWIVFEEPQTLEESQSVPKARKPTFGFSESRENRLSENVQGNNKHSTNKHRKTTTTPVVVEGHGEKDKDNDPSKAVSTADTDTETVKEIMATTIGTPLQGMISESVIPALVADYNPEAHQEHGPEAAPEGIKRLICWTAAQMSDPKATPIPNPVGFLRRMAEKGMDKPAAIIRQEQAVEAERREAEERKRRRDAEARARAERLTEEERKQYIDSIIKKLEGGGSKGKDDDIEMLTHDAPQHRAQNVIPLRRQG